MPKLKFHFPVHDLFKCGWCISTGILTGFKFFAKYVRPLTISVYRWTDGCTFTLLKSWAPKITAVGVQTVGTVQLLASCVQFCTCSRPKTPHFTCSVALYIIRICVCTFTLCLKKTYLMFFLCGITLATLIKIYVNFMRMLSSAVGCK